MGSKGRPRDGGAAFFAFLAPIQSFCERNSISRDQHISASAASCAHHLVPIDVISGGFQFICQGMLPTCIERCPHNPKNVGGQFEFTNFYCTNVSPLQMANEIAKFENDVLPCSRL